MTAGTMTAVRGIQEIDNPERLRYFRAIDQLRSLGVNEELPLPQARIRLEHHVPSPLTKSPRLLWLETSPAGSHHSLKVSLVSRSQLPPTYAHVLQHRLSCIERLEKSPLSKPPLSRAPPVWTMRTKRNGCRSLIYRWPLMS